MDISHIKELLRGYRKLLLRDDERRKHVVDVVRNITNISLDEHAVEVTKGEIRFKVGFAEKNEIFLRQEKIIEELHNRSMGDITALR